VKKAKGEEGEESKGTNLRIQIITHFNSAHHITTLHLFLDQYPHLDIRIFDLLRRV
jgi:hypothetical protein